MKKTALLLPVALFLSTLPCAAQGPLAPPGGPPGKVMKTLAQIEPRTPISSLPYMITNAGSYYLTSNLGSTTNGIVINTSRVTVNMMGFSIVGGGASGGHGIHVQGLTNAGIDKVVIKEGTISGFKNGLYCEYMNNSRIEHLVVSDNHGRGIYLDGYAGECKGNTIGHCSINDNGDDGVTIYAGDAEQCDGNRVQGNQVSKNTGNGIRIRATGTRVEANHVSGTTGSTTYGIKTSDTPGGNLILKNTCIGQDYNFSLDPDDTSGPIVTNSGYLAPAGDASHPWANFSR